MKYEAWRRGGNHPTLHNVVLGTPSQPPTETSETSLTAGGHMTDDAFGAVDSQEEELRAGPWLRNARDENPICKTLVTEI